MRGRLVVQTCARALPLCGTALIAVLAAPAVAQEAAADGQVVEDAGGNTIVVVGRLREESVQDIPASVTALAGEALQERGITDVEQLANIVPNFRYTTNAGPSDNLIIRGIGTVGSGPQFEPAVGQQLNGVALTRSRIGRAGLVDVGQVEVLRGPQGAVVGKNTSLGLVNIVPNKPTDQFEASLFTRYDFEALQGFEIEGVVSGPLTEGVRARIAANFKDKDGPVLNLNPNSANRTAGAVDDFSIRGIVDFDIADRGNFELFGQYVQATRSGKPLEIAFCNNPAAVHAAIGDDCTLNRTQVNQAIVDGQTVSEDLDIEFYLTSATANYDLTDDLTVTSITSYADYRMTDLTDVDISPSEAFVDGSAEDFRQFSQELRLAGSLADGLDFILGGLYSHYGIDFAQNSTTLGVGPPALRNRNRHRFAFQRNDGLSVFGDLTYELTPELTINGGLRYIHEKRKARAGQVLTDPYSLAGVLAANSTVPSCFALSGLFNCSMFPLTPDLVAGTVLAGADTSRPFSELIYATGLASPGPFFSVTDEDVTWNVNAQWRPDNDHMLYASAATGFKSGNFNLTASLVQAALEDNFSFEPETTTNYELGGRHALFLGDADLTFNWTLFRLEIENQQVSSLDPANLAQVIQSDADGRSQGIEIFGSLKIDNFSAGFDAAYTDAEYTDFTGATCYDGQTAAQGCVGGAQDRTGTTFVQAPEWQFSVNASADLDISTDLVLTPFVEVVYVGSHFTDTELNPISINDAYANLNASLTLAKDDRTWEVALVGSNLTDETHIGFFNENAFIPGGGSFAFPNVGRQIALSARVRY
jgi:iron complex outermembrane receptor protein